LFVLSSPLPNDEVQLCAGLSLSGGAHKGWRLRFTDPSALSLAYVVDVLSLSCVFVKRDMTKIKEALGLGRKLDSTPGKGSTLVLLLDPHPGRRQDEGQSEGLT